MSRKDYQLIAQAVREAREVLDGGRSDQMVIDTVVISLTNKLSGDNVRFDRGKFIKACEIGG